MFPPFLQIYYIILMEMIEKLHNFSFCLLGLLQETCTHLIFMIYYVQAFILVNTMSMLFLPLLKKYFIKMKLPLHIGENITILSYWPRICMAVNQHSFKL